MRRTGRSISAGEIVGPRPAPQTRLRGDWPGDDVGLVDQQIGRAAIEHRADDIEDIGDSYENWVTTILVSTVGGDSTASVS